MLHTTRTCNRQAGFTLMEVMLATALGAILVTATATMTGSFGNTVAHLNLDSVDSYEATLARLTRDVRYAWWADVPSAGKLLVADTDNAITEYSVVGDSLLVTRPDGSQGAVISGLSDVSFEGTATRRLREGPVATVNGRLDSVATPVSVPGSMLLVPGNSLSLAFDVNSNAGPRTASGVDDRILRFVPDRLDLRLARMSAGGQLHVEIYRSRAPGDARPRPGASALVSFDIGLRLLSLGTVAIPATNPLDLTTAIYAAPATTTSIAIPAINALLPPGTGYCVVLSVTGTGSIGIVGAWVSPTGAQRSVAFRQNAAAAWADQAKIIPMGIYGDATITTTVATDVTTQISMSLVSSEGVEHIASACPSSQVLAEDPWLGVVPNESPSLP